MQVTTWTFVTFTFSRYSIDQIKISYNLDTSYLVFVLWAFFSSTARRSCQFFLASKNMSIRPWMGPPKKTDQHIHMLSRIFWVEKPLYIMFTEKKTGNEKKLRFKDISPFFVVTKGRLRLLSWLHLHQCLTSQAVNSGIHRALTWRIIRSQ